MAKTPREARPASKETAFALHELTARVLIAALEGTTDEDGNHQPPTAAHIANAIKFLVAQNITCDSAGHDYVSALKDVVDNLPFVGGEHVLPS
jgi:hypothetical protein